MTVLPIGGGSEISAPSVSQPCAEGVPVRALSRPQEPGA